jgi:hypothetical protein
MLPERPEKDATLPPPHIEALDNQRSAGTAGKAMWVKMLSAWRIGAGVIAWAEIAREKNAAAVAAASHLVIPLCGQLASQNWSTLLNDLDQRRPDASRERDIPKRLSKRSRLI